jgi:hypothetical protein
MTLVHNTPIKRRVFKTDIYKKDIDTHYRLHENKNPRQMSGFGDSPVNDYNLWFHYIKLLVEMEHNRLTFTKPKISDPKKTDKSVIGKDIKINKIRYTGWDLDKILESKFSKWWKNHRYLFGKSYTVEMKKSSEWMEGMGLNGNVNLTHIRIDIRNSDNEITKDVRKILKERRGKTLSKIKVAGQVTGASKTYEMLVFNYNVMVRHLNGESPLDIFLAEKNRFRELRTSRHIADKIQLGGKTLRKVGKWGYKVNVEGRGRNYKMDGTYLWTTYTRWWKIKDEPSEIKKTVEYKGEKVDLKSPTNKGNLEKNLIKGVEELIRNTVLETQDILLGVSEGSFVKKIKLTYDPKTGKRSIPKL